MSKMGSQERCNYAYDNAFEDQSGHSAYVAAMCAEWDNISASAKSLYQIGARFGHRDSKKALVQRGWEQPAPIIAAPGAGAVRSTTTTCFHHPLLNQVTCSQF